MAWIRHVLADVASVRRQMLDEAAFLDFVVQMVRRSDPGFAILPNRWAVEQTFSWLTRYRRLVRDYEARIDVSEAMGLRRHGQLTHPTHRLSVSLQTDSKGNAALAVSWSPLWKFGPWNMGSVTAPRVTLSEITGPTKSNAFCCAWAGAERIANAVRTGSIMCMPGLYTDEPMPC